MAAPQVAATKMNRNGFANCIVDPPGAWHAPCHGKRTSEATGGCEDAGQRAASVLSCEGRDYQLLTRASGAWQSAVPSSTSKASYQGSMLRTVSARYAPGACTSPITRARSAGSRILVRQACP